jgi:hypothetical protein
MISPILEQQSEIFHDEIYVKLFENSSPFKCLEWSTTSKKINKLLDFESIWEQNLKEIMPDEWHIGISLRVTFRTLASLELFTAKENIRGSRDVKLHLTSQVEMAKEIYAFSVCIYNTITSNQQALKDQEKIEKEADKSGRCLSQCNKPPFNIPGVFVDIFKKETFFKWSSRKEVFILNRLKAQWEGLIEPIPEEDLIKPIPGECLIKLIPENCFSDSVFMGELAGSQEIILDCLAAKIPESLWTDRNFIEKMAQCSLDHRKLLAEKINPVLLNDKEFILHLAKNYDLNFLSFFTRIDPMLKADAAFILELTCIPTISTNLLCPLIDKKLLSSLEFILQFFEIAQDRAVYILNAIPLEVVNEEFVEALMAHSEFPLAALVHQTHDRNAILPRKLLNNKKLLLKILDADSVGEYLLRSISQTLMGDKEVFFKLLIRFNCIGDASQEIRQDRKFNLLSLMLHNTQSGILDNRTSLLESKFLNEGQKSVLIEQLKAAICREYSA